MSVESETKGDVNTNGTNDKAITDFKSKEYMESMKAMTFWQSIGYLFHRKVDTSDDNYRDQFVRGGETGADRIRLMWSEQMSGEDNPEMRFIMQSIGYGGGVGALYGGIMSNRTAVEDFIRRHNEYVFRGQFEGKRRIHDTMFLQLARYGFRWGWRFAVFSGLLSGLTTHTIAYRNDVYVSDCMISGAVVCGLWKAKLGLRAATVSAVLGSVFGIIFAASLKLMLWTFNTTVPEYRHWRHTRYLGHMTVEKYSDDTTEYDWAIDPTDAQTNSQNQKQNSS